MRTAMNTRLNGTSRSCCQWYLRAKFSGGGSKSIAILGQCLAIAGPPGSGRLHVVFVPKVCLGFEQNRTGHCSHVVQSKSCRRYFDNIAHKKKKKKKKKSTLRIPLL